ncbi:MAG: OmpH family outer membrane protein [Bacteroidota bacterium]
MNRLSFLLNIVLLVAVIILYYLHFSAPDVQSRSQAEVIDSLAKSINTTQEQRKSEIVYVNSDSLFEKYEYYKKVKQSTEQKLSGFEALYNQRQKSLAQDYNDYIDKAGAGLYTKEKSLQIEADLKKRNEELANMEKQYPVLQDQVAKELADVQNRLYLFFKAFSKANNYSCILTFNTRGEGALGINDQLDVTNEVIAALNAEYQESLKNTGKDKESTDKKEK